VESEFLEVEGLGVFVRLVLELDVRHTMEVDDPEKVNADGVCDRVEVAQSEIGGDREDMEVKEKKGLTLDDLVKRGEGEEIDGVVDEEGVDTAIIDVVEGVGLGQTDNLADTEGAWI